MKRTVDFLKKREAFVLFFITLLFSLRFFYNPYFITIDGAAHLYNANLIWSSLTGDFPLADQFYQWNPEPVPNWTGHFLLVLLNAFLPALLAEKILLVMYLFGMVFSLRYLIRTIRPENGYMALLAVPFAFNTFLYFGFYNFCISLIFIFLLSAYVIRNRDSWNAKSYMGFGFLLLLTYFSHLSAFLMAGLFLLLFALSALITSTNKQQLISRFKKYLILFLFCLPTLILVAWYFSRRSNGGELIYLSAGEVFQVFRYLRSLIVYGDLEAVWTSKLLYILVLCSASIFVYRLIKRTYFEHPDVLLYTAMLVAFAAFVLPDSDTRGGYMILRVALIAFLFLIAWIAVQPVPLKMQLLMLIAVLWLNTDHNRKKDETQKYFNGEAKEITMAGELIPENEVVFPLYRNVDWDWISAHHSNYIAVDRSIIVLENYEAAQDYFPLMYQKNTPAPIVYSVERENYCGELLKQEKFSAKSFNYVMEFGTDLKQVYPCEERIDTLLQFYFLEIYSGEFVRLHKRK